MATAVGSRVVERGVVGDAGEDDEDEDDDEDENGAPLPCASASWRFESNHGLPLIIAGSTYKRN